MAKIRAEYVRHGPIRWLMRITGIVMLIAGIAGLLGFEGSLTYMTDSPIQALIVGIVCIGLDILVAVTDPRKKVKKATYSYTSTYTSASANAAARVQARQSVLATLQQVRGRADYPQVLQSLNAPQLETVLRSNKDAAVEFCRRTGKIEVLAYVQLLNPQAAEVLIQELVMSLCSKNTAKK